MSAVYFGGSRSLTASPIIGQVVSAVQAAGHAVHVGCQLGADLQVVQAAIPSSLVVFAVASIMSISNHLQVARVMGARVISCAGGTVAPIKARYLLRSLAAAKGCEAAVFFQPGPGSLAVASHLVSSMPVYVFSQQPPAPISGGSWRPSVYFGFFCWQWSSLQPALF